MVRLIPGQWTDTFTGIPNMTISAISSSSAAYVASDSASIVRGNLEALAKLHRCSVDELLKSAASAGPDGPAYLNRALLMKARLDKLEAND